MDKLRSLQYFVAAAEEKSLSGAARRFGVSTQAVAKLVSALEQGLGVRLFERTAHGLTLTASGAAYLQSCLPALAQLHEADELMRAPSTPGTVVVGVQHVIAREVLTPALPRFHARHPQIRIDVHDFNRVADEQIDGVDVFLVLGWPRANELVLRAIAASRLIAVASPAYWAAHGMPRHPSELEGHNCMCIRSNHGSVMDLWRFRRGDESVAVTAGGWLVVDNAHRDMVRDLALAGAGVIRVLDWHQRQGREIASGALVPVLTDWQMTDEVPPVNLMYPPSARRIARVRLFMDFVVQLFREIEQQRQVHAPATAMPRWVVGRRPRASATVGTPRRER